MLRINKQMNMNQVAKYNNLMPYHDQIMMLRRREISLEYKREELVKKILKETDCDPNFVRAIVYDEDHYVRKAIVKAGEVEEEHEVEHALDTNCFWKACENSVEKV